MEESNITKLNPDMMLTYSIWLSSIPGLGPVYVHNLLSVFHSPEAVFHANASELTQIPGIGNAKASAILSSRDLTGARKIIDDCCESGVSVTYIGHQSYPRRLSGLIDMPTVLYYKGTLTESVQTVAIVGPRSCSRTARNQAIAFSEDYSKKGFAIISGMAIGIDSYAHTSAIKKDAYTIAVLGCGADICYPSAHKKLYDSIVRHGAVISEYPPHTRPRAFSFPLRNRIIAGLSDAVYIIGAGPGSGSLITADYARKYGKEVSFINCSEPSGLPSGSIQ